MWESFLYLITAGGGFRCLSGLSWYDSAMLTECLAEQGEEGVAHQELVQSRPALPDHGQHQDDAGARRVHDATAYRVWRRIGPQMASAEVLLGGHRYREERSVMAGKA